MKFQDININNKLKRALSDLKYETPSPIQEEAIPVLLEGHDMIGVAQTGTGKTCAFMVPIIQKIMQQTENFRSIKALILTPTRELAIQIYENTLAYSKYTRIKSLAIFGGVKEGTQKTSLKNGVDILIATPGRLLDFLNQKCISVANVETFVLDEADRMLDMGFIKDVQKIIKHIPSKRQTLLFSATMPKDIRELCNTILVDPVTITVTPPATTVDAISQKLYYVDKVNKPDFLSDLIKSEGIFRALVFSRTKYGADKIAKFLIKKGIKASAIHGDKSQNARQKALNDFKDNKLQVLVATDIASRGIDIQELSHVINYDLPDTPETYVHRIGRTARAGHEGIAITLCSFPESDMVKEIEKTCKIKIPVFENIKYPMTDFSTPEKKGSNNKKNSMPKFKDDKKPLKEAFDKKKHSKSINHGKKTTKPNEKAAKNFGAYRNEKKGR